MKIKEIATRHSNSWLQLNILENSSVVPLKCQNKLQLLHFEYDMQRLYFKVISLKDYFLKIFAKSPFHSEGRIPVSAQIALLFSKGETSFRDIFNCMSRLIILHVDFIMKNEHLYNELNGPFKE